MWCSKVILKLSRHEWRSSETSLCSVVPPVRHIQMSLLVRLRQTGVWRPLWLCWCQSDAAAVICSQAWTQFETAVVTNLQQRVHLVGMLEKIHEITEHHSERLVLNNFLLHIVFVFVKRGGNTICSCYFHFHLRVMVRSDSSCLFAVKFTRLHCGNCRQ